MPVTEQVMALGEWSLQLRPDTPQSVRERISVAFSHVVITSSWVDVSNAGLSDDAILSAARYTGVALRPGPQLALAGQGLAWWLANADNQPWNIAWAAHSAVTWSTAYTAAVGTVLDVGTIASGGSFTIPAQRDISRRNRVDVIAQSAGHEWRINPDLTFDAGTVVDLYGTTPTVALVDGASSRGGGGLVGIEATLLVEEDWEQWGNGVVISGNWGYAGNSAPLDDSPSLTPVGESHSMPLRLDAPEIPPSFSQALVDDLADAYNVPRYEVSVEVTDRALVDHVRPGDLLYVYDEMQGLRDLANQVQHNGRTIWPKIMRATRMSWPVRQGMGVYWRTWETGDASPYWTDLTPYVQWEDGDADLDIIQGDPARYSLNPATGRADVVGAAIERAAQQPWNDYTPSWTSSSTQPTLGNGSVTGAYRRLGTSGHARALLLPGSGSSVGTGNLRLSLPDGWTIAGTWQGGSCWWFDATTGIPVTGSVIAQGGNTYIEFTFDGAAASRFQTSALANGDIVCVGPIELEIDP